MSISFVPKPRMILSCDFRNFSAPEMTKNRPVVILASSPARPRLCQIVPISQTPPRSVERWHHPLSRASSWDRDKRWVKCDMIYTVSFDRLDRWKLGIDGNGKRKYLSNFLVSDEDFVAIKQGLAYVLNLQLAE